MYILLFFQEHGISPLPCGYLGTFDIPFYSTSLFCGYKRMLYIDTMTGDISEYIQDYERIQKIHSFKLLTTHFLIICLLLIVLEDLCDIIIY